MRKKEIKINNERGSQVTIEGGDGAGADIKGLGLNLFVQVEPGRVEFGLVVAVGF